MTLTVPPEAPPGSARRALLPYLVVAWAVGYGALRLWWAVAGAPEFPPLGTDLVVFTGWWAVALCAAGAAVAGGLATARSWHPALAVTGWAVCAAIVLSCALLLLDLVGFLILAPTDGFTVAAFLSRVGCFTGAVLLNAAVVGHRRRYRGDCRDCGRTGAVARRGVDAAVPAWARIAAYAATAGCLLRLAAQLAVGFGDMPLAKGASMAAFEVGFLLAGVLLPLALVHSWGRIWPRWVPLLAGRRIPRAVLLVPAAVFSVGLIVYFGVGIADLTVETVTGTFDPGDGRFPLAFFWVAEPAYWLWGWGLGLAALSFHQRTRRPCRACGR